MKFVSTMIALLGVLNARQLTISVNMTQV